MRVISLHLHHGIRKLTSVNTFFCSTKKIIFKFIEAVKMIDLACYELLAVIPSNYLAMYNSPYPQKVGAVLK